MVTDLIKNLDKIVSDIETKLIPSNIREGISILGIEGSLEEMFTEHRIIEPAINTQIVIPEDGYDGFHEVIVKAVKASIDKNIVQENIRYGKRILGIPGSLSKLSESEYNEMLLMEFQILGYTIYVFRTKLVLNGEEYSVNDNTLSTKGIVEGNKLIIN